MHRRKHINHTVFFRAKQCDHSIILKSKNCRSNVTTFSNCELGSNSGLFFQIVPTRVSFFFSRSRASGMEYKNYCKDNFSQNVQFFDQIFDNSCSLVYFSSNCRIFSGINLHLPVHKMCWLRILPKFLFHTFQVLKQYTAELGIFL